VVRGNVQGVGFRWACEAQARGLGVRGRVRNRRDGGVEVDAEGEPAALAALVEWLHQGPRHAHVTSVQVSVVPPQGWHGFEIEL
ncbi:MAG TPA: acylphosphatase, partial [Actinotalea sp.]|nr:acylphosphatase [Actinotalea sp.]